MRKFRRLPKSAMLRIKHAERRLLNRRNNARRNPPAAPRKRLRPRNRTLHHLRLLHHVAMFFLVSVGDAGQNALEARTAIAVGRRKIGSSIERLAVRRKKSSERTTALPAHRA